MLSYTPKSHSIKENWALRLATNDKLSVKKLYKLTEKVKPLGVCVSEIEVGNFRIYLNAHCMYI